MAFLGHLFNHWYRFSYVYNWNDTLWYLFMELVKFQQTNMNDWMTERNNRQMKKQTNEQTNKQTNQQMNKQTDKWTNKKRNKQTKEQTNKQTNKQINK